MRQSGPSVELFHTECLGIHACQRRTAFPLPWKGNQCHCYRCVEGAGTEKMECCPWCFGGGLKNTGGRSVSLYLYNEQRWREVECQVG